MPGFVALQMLQGFAFHVLIQRQVLGGKQTSSGTGFRSLLLSVTNRACG